MKAKWLECRNGSFDVHCGPDRPPPPPPPMGGKADWPAQLAPMGVSWLDTTHVRIHALGGPLV